MVRNKQILGRERVSPDLVGQIRTANSPQSPAELLRRFDAVITDQTTPVAAGPYGQIKRLAAKQRAGSGEN